MAQFSQRISPELRNDVTGDGTLCALTACRVEIRSMLQPVTRPLPNRHAAYRRIDPDTLALVQFDGGEVQLRFPLGSEAPLRPLAVIGFPPSDAVSRSGRCGV